MFDYTAGYPSIRQPFFADNVVATSQPLAAQAGVDMLRRGGNAVDAAIATAIALTVVEPCSNGIGSDAFAIVWDGTQVHGLNASGRSPEAWSLDYMRSRGYDSVPLFGWDSVTVPGTVSAWVELSQRFGRLAFDDLFEPAIRYARDGFHVTEAVSRAWKISLERLADQPGFVETFGNGGAAPQAGQRVVLPGHAAGLTSIAKTKGESFYRGDIAAAIARSARLHGGAMTIADLDAHTNDWVHTTTMDYAGHTLHEIPPNGQGIAAQMALGILAHFDLASMDPDSVASQHLQIEAIKLAFADAYAYVADADAMSVTPADLLDPAYLASRAALIDPTRAQEFAHGELPRGGTVYLTTADADGMMVSFIQSNYMGFGSGVVIPEYGIALQNRGNGFVMEPAHPNRVAGAKRPFHTIIPAFLTRDGQPVMSFGVMGGHMQPQGHAQILVRMLTYGMHPQQASDAPRFRWNGGVSINAEQHFPAETLNGLRALGHQIADRNEPWEFGTGQFIYRLPTGGYVAATDTRREGVAIGF